MPTRTHRLPATPDGQSSLVYVWQGSAPATGVVILAHGMGEHALRYEPLAQALVAAGFDVYANDHRGHGQTVREASQLGDYGPEGWRGLVDDALGLARQVRTDYDVPVLIMGHSMGSMLVQHLLTEASELYDGAALSGTTAVDVMAAASATAGTEEESAAQAETDLFARFNAAFEPVRTPSDWLSRDPEQVDLYVNDPLCGFSVTDESFASLMEAGAAYSSPEATSRIRRDLPIYLFAGDKDPVGAGGVLVAKVADRYREAGIEDVELKLYPDARHEVFNETNREEVVRDFLDWATRVRDSTDRRASK
jgi:alpha-beta hydrolase superfamily lysophospholipase